MEAVITITFPQTQGPGYMTHFEITREGGTIILQSVNRRGYAVQEAEIEVEAFFEALEKLK